MPNDEFPTTEPSGALVPPGRVPPTAIATATPPPPPRSVLDRVRSLTLKALDIADAFADTLMGRRP
ncbi:MAG: hypothetical protein SFU84_16290 [Gemmatimonadales bacterium]|nr:hypothetical protein [Gemmatimonadales bacterium]